MALQSIIKEVTNQSNNIVNNFLNSASGAITSNSTLYFMDPKTPGSEMSSTSTGKDIGTKSIKEVTGKTEELVGKIQQRAEKVSQENAVKLRTLAENLVKERLDQAMNTALTTFGNITNMSQEQRSKMSAIIRGYKYLPITKGTIFQDAVNNAEKVLKQGLKNEISKQMKNVNGAVNDLNNQIKNGTGELISQINKGTNILNGELNKGVSIVDGWIDQGLGKIEGMSNLIQNIKIGDYLDKINSSVLKGGGLKEICDRIDSSLGKSGIGKILGGGNIKSMNFISGMLKNIEGKIGGDIENKIKPFINKHLAVVKKLTETVKNIREQFKQAVENLKNFLKHYEELAMNFIMDFTGKLASEISKAVNISFDGLGGALGGTFSEGIGGGFGGGLGL